MNLYILGLVLLSQVIGQQKVAKSYGFIQSMPAPRVVAFLATLAGWVVTAWVVGRRS